jgi:hypothetical protein
MMKRFMLIAAVIMLSSVVAADPVHIQFTGYVEDNYLTPAGSEYFGVLPGDEFVCDFVYDPDIITFRTGVNTNALDDHFVQRGPAGETGIMLAVNSPSQYMTQTDPLNGSYYVHIIDSSANSQPGRVNVWAPGLVPDRTQISMGLYEQDYSVALNGSTFPEIHLERLLRGRISVTCSGFRFMCTITESTLIEKTPPVIEVDIDIKPGSDRNPINLKSKGVVPVAMFGAEDFDVTWIDDPLAVVLFDCATGEYAGASPIHFVVKDLDWDGFDDILFHFSTQELALHLGTGTKEACLVGTIGEGLFMGTDTVDAFLKRKKK